MQVRVVYSYVCVCVCVSRILIVQYNGSEVLIGSVRDFYTLYM